MDIKNKKLSKNKKALLVYLSKLKEEQQQSTIQNDHKKNI